MKRLAVVLFGLVVLHGAVTAHPESRTRTWDPSRDFAGTGNQISFHQGTRRVWYFMESRDLTRDPLLYRYIHDYTAPGHSLPGVVVPDGYSCWQHPVDLVPAVCFNFNAFPVYIGTTEMAPLRIEMHPGPQSLSILAWKSPLDGAVAIRGAFEDIDSLCGNGFAWFVDRGNESLASGDVPSGEQQSFSLARVRVKKGEVLYFILDPKDSDYYCDSTGLDVTITTTGSRR